MGPVRIATAAWQIPRAVAERFPAAGSTLQRYAGVFDAVEINSSFYRSHQPKTWERWAASVPTNFRFAVKAPRSVTHEHRLANCSEALDRFLAETAMLGDRRGPVLFQTPGSLPFDPAVFAAFAADWRARFGGDTAWEPRHPSWFTDEADAAFVAARIARVAADPSPRQVSPPEAGRPGGWPGLIYRRLHGAPRVYVTPYAEAYLAQLASETVASPVSTWIAFDNTMSGAAADNALSLKEMLAL